VPILLGARTLFCFLFLLLVLGELLSPTAALALLTVGMPVLPSDDSLPRERLRTGGIRSSDGVLVAGSFLHPGAV
jgi:hypothetical protein